MTHAVLTALGLTGQESGTYLGHGEWSATRDAGVIEPVNPSNGEVLGKVYASSQADYDLILERAQAAFKVWRTTPAPKRGEAIRLCADALRKHKDALGSLVALEMGKSKPEGDGEVQEMIDIGEFAVGLSRQLYGLTMHSERPGHRMYEQYQPLGIVGIISAFNFPVAVWAWNSFLATICGDICLWKPSNKTPLTAIASMRICNEALREAGFPDLFFLINDAGTALSEKMVADKRVREAMNIAINREAVKRVVMRGQSVPAGIVAPPFIDGYDKALDVVPAPDVARAKALLAEAGYPNGFAVTLSCPNDRYVNDEAICQAVTGMFGQIGVKARLDARPKSIHFAELPKGELDLYMLGWGVPTMDSHYVFHYLYETRTDKGGAWNVTGYSSPKVDELTRAMTREIDLGRRAGMVAETWKTVQDDVVYLPIHHQMLNWAMKDNIDFPVQSENYPYFKLLKFKK